MTYLIVVLLATFGGFCIGRAYERVIITDKLLDIAAEHREEMIRRLSR